MRVVIVENSTQNLKALTDIIKSIQPNAIIKGFTDGNEATNWCNENSFCVDLFIGNWWGTNEEFSTPEGANVFNLVKWYKKPKKILVADEIMFERLSYNDDAIGFVQRPATKEKIEKILKNL